MKSFVLFAFVLACTLGFLDETYAKPLDATTVPSKQVKEPKEIKESATASKKLKDVMKAAMKAGKDAKKNKKDCMKECGTVYDLICAHDPNDATFKPRTFDTECALDVHNCEMGTKLTMKQKGECPGSGDVRLPSSKQLPYDCQSRPRYSVRVIQLCP